MNGSNQSGSFSITISNDTVKIVSSGMHLKPLKRALNAAINQAIKEGDGCIQSTVYSDRSPFRIRVVNCDIRVKEGFFKRWFGRRKIGVVNEVDCV